MKFKLKLTVLLFLLLLSSVFAGVKDTLFYQEYHEAYPLNSEKQNDVRCITVDNKDNVWVGTYDGLFKLNNTSKKWEAKLSENNQGPIFDLFLDSKNNLWVAAWNGLYILNDSRVSKVSSINDPISCIAEVNKSIIAFGPNGIWQKVNNNWKSKNIPFSRSLRSAITDNNVGYFVATGKGLYHKYGNNIEIYQDENEIISDNISSIEYNRDGELWVGGLGGVSVYKNNEWIKSYTPDEGLANSWVNCIKMDPSGVMWIGTRLGISRFNGKDWSLRFSKRWIIDDNVKDIDFDSNGNGWIATSKGVSVIKKKKITLEQKVSYYYNKMKRRHIREPYLVESCSFKIEGDTNSWVPRDNDNDGQYTSMYLAMESYKYAVTKDKEAKENATKAFKALQFLQSVTETEGFVARTVIPVEWKTMANPNKTISDREWAEKLVDEPRLNRIENMWLPSSDGKWLWKRGTSSDEIAGHMYGYYIYYELVATGKEKENVKNQILKIVDYIIKGDYVLIDVDGKKTEWGVWAPEYLNDNPDWATEKGINSVEILSFLKLAHYVSGNDKYQTEFNKLFFNYNYGKNILKAKSTIKSWITYIDDELLALSYPILVDREINPVIKSEIRKSLDQWYSVLEKDDNPYFYSLYNGLTKNKLKIDRTIFLLQDNPLDLISWKIDHTKREDLYITRKPILENLQMSRLVPPSERAAMRWDRNPWMAVTGSGGHSERDGVAWMLAYWVGRYYNIID